MNFDQIIEKAIPHLPPVDWDKISDIPIVECHEALVPAGLYPERILARSIYFQQKYPEAYPEVYVREEVYEKLVQAAESLPPGYRLVIFDGWRPIDLQRSLHEEYVEELAGRFPEKPEAELHKLAAQYVATPSSDPKSPSPHSSGGSVDLSISDPQGRLLYMGGDFDEKSSRSETRYYESSGINDPKALSNRRLLYHIMTAAGFTNYSEEWWHYDFGNQNWAYFSTGEKAARYGIVNP